MGLDTAAPLSPDALAATLARELAAGAPRMPLRRPPSSSARATVRVFVSSTFCDFVDERRALNALVLPQLLRRCRERGLDLVLVDLLWGIPEDTTGSDTLRVCMGEIDAGAAANGAPFFLFLSGWRQGWVPAPADLPAELREPPVAWVDGVSITTMELLHGAARGGNPNALFCLRSKAYAQAMAEALPEARSNYIQAPDVQEALQAHLRSAFQGALVEYDPGTAGKADFAPFAAAVIEGLWARISAQYPPLPVGATPGSLPAQSAQHEAALAALTGTAAPRPRLVHAVTDAVAATAARGGVVVLVGSSGAGKSTALGQAMLALRASGATVVPHVTGCADRSDEVGALASRLVVATRLAELASTASSPSDSEEAAAVAAARAATIDGADLPGDPLRVCAIAASLIRDVSLAAGSPTLVLAVDAINQLGGDAPSKLAWLPPPGDVARSVVVLISCTPGAEADALSCRSDALRLNALPLDEAEARELLTHVLRARYAKALAPANLDALLAKTPGARSPLWLMLALTRLVTLGRGGSEAQGGTLHALIEALPGDLEGPHGLLQLSVDAAEARSERTLVRGLLLASALAPSDLRESEAIALMPVLVRALAEDAPAAPATDLAPLPPLTWALLRSACDMLLRPAAPGAEALVAPAHALVGAVVLERYGDRAARVVLTAMAAFFECGSEAVEPARRAVLAPPIYQALGDPRALSASLCCEAVLELAARDDSSAYLVMRWARAAGSGTYAAAAAALEAWAERALDESTSSGCAALDSLAALFSFSRMHQLPRAVRLLERVLRAQEAAHGATSLPVAATLHALAAALHKLGRHDEALAAFERALAIRIAANGDDAPLVGATLSAIGDLHLFREDYEPAAVAYDRALIILKARLGEWSPAVAATLGSLATLAFKGGDFAKANELHARAHHIRTKVLGPDHHDVATSLIGMATFKIICQDLSGVAMLQRAVDIRTRALGPEHPITAGILHIQALMLGMLGDAETGLAKLACVRAIRLAFFEASHALYCDAENASAYLNTMLGRPATALALLEHSVPAMKAALGPRHLWSSQGLLHAGRARLQAGDAAAAVALLEEARQGQISDNFLWWAFTTVALADSFAQLGDVAKAEALTAEACERVAATMGPEPHIMCVQVYVSRAAALVRAARFDEALALCASTMALVRNRERSLHGTHGAEVDLLRASARAHAGLGNAAAAAAAAAEALALLEARNAVAVAKGLEAHCDLAETRALAASLAAALEAAQAAASC